MSNPAEPGAVGAKRQALDHIRLSELGIRFGFGGAVSLVAGLVALAAGDATGGMFLAFPAILPATLTLIERHEGTSRAVSEARGAVLGAAALIGFACTVLALVGRQPVAALAVATTGWLLLAVALFSFGTRMASVLGESAYLPDVAAHEVQPAVEAVRAARMTLAVAESCTGGTLAALLTAVPGASDVMRGGVVAYDSAVKIEVLGVPREVIQREGAISEPAAVAMARGVRERLAADVGISITGNGATESEGKPPGCVYVCAMTPFWTRVERMQVTGGDEAIRAEAVRMAVRLCLDVTRDARESTSRHPTTNDR